MAASSAASLASVAAAGADRRLVDRELRQRDAAPGGLDHQPAARRHPVGERLAARVLDERRQVLDLALDRPRRRVGAVAAAAAVVVVGREPLAQHLREAGGPGVDRTVLERAADEDQRRPVAVRVEGDRRPVGGADGRGHRSCALTTLPIALRGSSSRKRTSRGRLWGASSEATWSISTFAVGLLALRHDPGHDPLAEVVVGRGGHRRLAHRGMLEQRDLDLARADLVAAGLDQVGRAAADDPPVAVGRARADVAGEEPAVADRLRGRVGAVEVAAEDVRAAHGDLADRLVVGLLHVGAVVGHQAHLDARERHADVAGPARRVGAHRRVHQRLREPVALDDLLARQLLDPGEDGGGQRRAARHEDARGAQPLGDRIVALGLLRDPVVHRRDAEQHRRAVAQRGRGGGGLEAAEVAQLAAPAQRAEDADHEPVDVEQRQPVREHVLAGPVPGVGERVEVGAHAAAREHGALGPAGRAARVDDQRRVLVAPLRARAGRRRGRRGRRRRGGRRRAAPGRARRG